MKKTTAIITITDKELYHDLATQFFHVFSKKYGSKMKSIFGGNTKPDCLKIRSSYGKNAKFFTCDYFSFVSNGEIIFSISNIKHPPKSLDLKQVVTVIAEDMEIYEYDLDIKKRTLKTDNKLFAFKIADLFKLETRTEKRYFEEPHKYFKFIVR
jgi:hypothetical protein